MMTFCNKNVYSLLGISSNNKDNGTVDLDHQNSTMKSPFLASPYSVSDAEMTTTKRDPGGIGFVDDIGGSVDGLMSCTESLGFESSDERRVDDQIDGLELEMMCNSRKESTKVGSKWKREHVKREVKNFPPPLSSLDRNGKPTFFLRPVRRDGKLELQEVRIGRPEILRASRKDGRLRLHLVSNEDEDFQEQWEEEKEEEEEIVEESEQDEQERIEESKMEEGIEGNVEEEEVEERVEGWNIPVNPGGGGGGRGKGGLRRCHEQVSHHQNHHQRGHHHHHHHHHPHRHELHVWSQNCVTIR